MQTKYQVIVDQESFNKNKKPPTDPTQLKPGILYHTAPEEGAKKLSGHYIYHACCIKRGQDTIPVYYKLNKHGKYKHSVYEIMFGGITQFFMGGPLFTPTSGFVMETDGKKITGTYSEDFLSEIKRNIADKKQIFLDIRALQANQWKRDKRKPLTQESNLGRGHGFEFLTHVPKFDELMNLQNLGRIKIDMDSLASIDVACHIFEEDDLHKENIGLYVTQANENEVPVVHFFKIDHDLMFIDSIISRQISTKMRGGRFGKNFYTPASFKITVRDLENLPDLQDSGNHYWRTRTRFMVHYTKKILAKPVDYTYAESKAYAELKHNRDYQHAKLNYLLKYIMVPDRFFDKILEQYIKLDDFPEEHRILLTALRERMSELRVALLSSEQFSNYIQTEGLPLKRKIISDVKSMCNALLPPNSPEIQTLDTEFEVTYHNLYSNLSQPKWKQEILLGDYRSNPQTYPTHQLEAALKLANSQFKDSLDHATKFKYQCIAYEFIDVLKQRFPYYYKNLDKKYECTKTNYTLSSSVMGSHPNFKEELKKISFANIPLKLQKKAALRFLKTANLSEYDLKMMKEDLIEMKPPMKFVCQLRNEYWFVRLIWGAYGQTKTARQIASIIDQRLAAIPSITKAPSNR